MGILKILLLLFSSSLCVGLMVYHSYKTRGRSVTLYFFSTCFIYSIARGHAVRYITSEQWGGSIPYIFSNDAVKIFGEPILTIVGWIFTIYLSWCLAERCLDQFRIPRANLFALSCFAFLSTACICYVVESAADSAGWWHWAMPLKNKYFAYVPVIGIIDWAAIISDFFIPFLLVFLSPLRKKWWRWLLFLTFPLHMLIHTPYQVFLPWLGYSFTFGHMLLFIIPILLAIFQPKWAAIEIITENDERQKSGINTIPIIVYFVLLAVTMGMQARAGFPPEHLISFGPIIVLGLLAFSSLNIAVMASFIITFLAIIHDPRWLSAIELLIICFLLGASAGSLFDLKRKYTLLFRSITITILLLISFSILMSEYQFEKSCMDYENNIIQPFITGNKNIPLDNLEQLSAETAAKAPADTNYISMLASSLEGKNAPLPLVAALYRKAVELDPEYSMPYNNLASVFYRMGKQDESLKILEEGNRNIPDNARILANLGFFYHNTGDYKTASEFLFRALDLDPGNYDIWLNITQVFLKLGNLEKAKEYFIEAERLNSESPKVKTIKAMIEFVAGDTGKAENTLKDILSEHPGFFLARSQLARLLESEKDWDGALKEYLKLADIQSLPISLWIRIFQISEKTEDPKNRLLVLENAYRQYPDSEDIMGQLAQIYTELDMYEDAADIYKKLIHKGHENFVAYLNLGAVLFESGRIEEAMKYTIRARDLNPESPVPDYNIGLFLLCSQKPGKAVEAYYRAIEQDKDGKYSLMALQELENSKENIQNKTDYAKIEQLLKDNIKNSKQNIK